MSSYRCQQVLINPNYELKAILEFVCEESNKLANCGIYDARQFLKELTKNQELN